MATRSTLHRLGLLTLVSAVAGLLVAGMLLPLVGGIGLAARTGANTFENLPAELSQPPLPQVSRILAADGSTIATFYYENRITVPLSQVPVNMQKAIIAIEDVRFYEHHGVDFKAVWRALLHNGSAGTVQQGGSTLTQQYVKNVLIESAHTSKGKEQARADTLARKAREARYAIALENKFSKSQILERYLNIAYFGDGAYGVGTAAKHFFGIPVKRLSLAQSALLAGLVQSPEVYNPAQHPQAAHDRRDTVLAQMLRYRFITQAQYDHALARPVRLHLHRQGNGCETSTFPYFCDYVLNVIKRSAVFGDTEQQRINLLLRGGLTIRTTLQPRVQRAADHAIQKYVPARDPSGVAAAEAVVEPGTGAVRAIAVSAPYGNNAKRGQNTVDYAVDKPYGGGIGRFPAGSTFKLFVLTAALKQGIPLATTIYAPAHIHDLTGYVDCAGHENTYPDVGNAGESESGNYNLVTGTLFSVNTFYAQLEDRTGLCMPVQLARAMGVRQGDGSEIPDYIPSFVLGQTGAGFSPMDIAGAYATMAAHGRYCSPVAITSVAASNGRDFTVPKSSCQQVVAPGLADTITAILHGVLTQPGATAYDVGEPGRPAAAKTGTADDNVASDFAGYVPQLAAAVWVGDPARPTTRQLNGLKIGGVTYGTVFGATIAGPIWRDTMEAALKGLPVIPLPSPDPKYVEGKKVPVPDVSGLSVTDATDALKQAGFKVAVGRGPVDSLLPKGTVAYTFPSGGGTAPMGSTVTMYISNGKPPKPKPSPKPTPTSPTPTPGESTTPTPTQSTKPPPGHHKPHH